MNNLTFSLTKRLLGSLLGLALWLMQPSAQAQYAQNMGINLGSPRHGLTFVDVMKETRGFATDEDRTAIPGRDANGWPTEDFQITLFDLRNPFGAGSLNVEGDGADPEEYVMDVSGTYSASFTGQANVSACCGVEVSNQSYNATTNTTTFDVTVPADFPYMSLVFTDTRRTSGASLNSGVTNLKVIRPGYALNTTQVFTDVWLEAIEPFSTYRYMDWSKTNGNAEFADAARTQPVEVDWADRKVAKPNEATTTGGPIYEDRGLPWETIIEHINTTGKDAWINVPVHASDDYLRQLARLLANNVAPSINIYVEYSNELWNYGGAFTQQDWNFFKAIEEVNSGSSNLNYDGSTNDNLWAARRAAKRTVEIAQIFQNEGVGTVGERLRPVLAYFTSQAGNLAAGGAFETMVNVLQYVEDNYGAPSDYFHNISRTGYFGAREIADLPEGASVSDILEAAERGIPTNYDEFSNLADQYGLQFTAYEAAPGHQVGSEKNLQNRIRAERSEEMGDLLKRSIVDAWFGSGGDLYMFFATSQYYTRFGFWGMTDDIQKLNRNFKYQALIDIINGTNINLRPIIAVDRLEVGLKNLPYEQPLDAYSGDAPLIWSIVSGSLPEGLSLSSSGVISGTPTGAGISNFTVEVADADGDTNTRSLSLQVISTNDIPLISTAPAIDGNAEALWNDIPSYGIDRLLSGSRSGASDISASFKTAWDADNLYLLVEVTDQTLITENAEPFKDDAVEVYLDINNDKLSSYGPDDYQIIFRYDDPNYAVTAGTDISGITRAETVTSDGYQMEIALPWAALGEDNPRDGAQLGIDIHVADDDDGGERDAKLSWIATVDRSFTDPSIFGVGILKETGSETPPGNNTFPIANTPYRLRHVQTGRFLDTGNNGNVSTKPTDDAGTDRVFRFVAKANSGTYWIVNGRGGRGALDTGGDGLVKWVAESNPSGADKQWAVVEAGNSQYYIRNQQNGRGWLAANASGGVFWTNTQSEATLWEPIPPTNARTADNSDKSLSTDFSLSEEMVLIFPNPVQDVLHLRLPARKGEVSVTLTDMLGRRVLEHRQSDAGEITLPVQELTSGLYQIRIEQAGEYTLQKLLVE
jgi:hypothetical protein